MRLTIANLSNSVSSEALNVVKAAIQEQVSKHFAPEWGRDAQINAVRAAVNGGKISLSGSHDAIIYLGDSVEDPTTGVEGALGYHSVNQADVPYGFIYLDVCEEYGEPWSSTLSHEVLELLADPTAATTITGPNPTGGGGYVYRDLEVCDPTQGDSYTVLGQLVSNFVGRAYFGQPGGSGQTNYLGLDLKPFGVRPKGYFQYEDGQGAHQVDGSLITERQSKAKAKLGDGRRFQRRANRINPQGKSIMANASNQQSLRVVLATNIDLRHKTQRAAATAAYQVLKEAGITISDNDLAEWNADMRAMAIPDAAGAKPGIQKDAGDVATGVLIGIATGF